MKKTFTPDNYKLVYSFDHEKKTFRQFKLHSTEFHNLLPDLIRLEKNNGFNSITGADTLLRIRNTSNWTKCSLAGLRPTENPNFYYSDLPIKGVKSLIVVFIPDDADEVQMRVCKQFYPHTPIQRIEIIKHLTETF